MVLENRKMIDDLKLQFNSFKEKDFEKVLDRLAALDKKVSGLFARGGGDNS